MESFDIVNPPGREEEIATLENYISQNKNIILLGARRVGKTTLLNAIEARKKESYKVIYYNCEQYREINHLFAYLFARSKKLKIFVSSIGTKEEGELKEERGLTEEILSKYDCEPFLIENYARPYSPEKVEEEEIKNSDVFLLILGKDKSENVKKEFEFALKYDIPILCLIKNYSGSNKEKGEIVQEIITHIKNIEKEKGGMCTYKRYYSLVEFKSVLEECIKNEKERWIGTTIDKYRKEEFRKVGDKFFEARKQSKDTFLILIDELGELRKDGKNNFEDFLAYLRGKTKEANNARISFVLTGSENVFTLESQKYFSDFEIVEINPFSKNVAKDVLRKIMKIEFEDVILEKIVALCGTLPADIKNFGEKFEWIIKANGKEKWKDAIIKSITAIVNKEGYRIEELFFKNLSSETRNFLEEVIIHLPATKNEMKIYFPHENFEGILKEVTQNFIILKQDEGLKYDCVSRLLRLCVIKRKNPSLFNGIISSDIK
ncbi:MAG: hypothetical protein BWK75_05400 [Candidatus Altiarchaeales archaeon A3]|nr:MAG: hypothetical protein BWK75_05400 [Candidatus Altiarchaeales archaeon A3]